MMRVLVTGASGFIGGHIVAALRTRGHTPVAAVKTAGMATGKAAGTLARLEIVEIDFGAPPAQDEMQRILTGHRIDVVVNAAGVIRENRASTFAAVHTDGPIALFDACKNAGVRLVVQISALGADDAAKSRFHLSKKAADDHLAGLGIDSLIIQPSFVYGPGEGSMDLFKRISTLPVLLLVGRGDQQVQPIHVEDLASAVAGLIDRCGAQASRAPEAPPYRLRLAAVSPHPVTFARLLELLRAWLTLKPTLKLRVPMPFMRALARAGDALGRGPITTESLQMLQRGNTAGPRPFSDAAGLIPRTIEEGFPPGGATPSERRHYRMSPLTPLLRWSIAFIWIATGIISAFLYPASESLQMLARSGIEASAGLPILYATSAFEILLGLATLFRYRTKLVCVTQIALILGFTVIISATLPEFWLHPFGPITKNIPIIAATLVLIVLDDS